MSILADIVEGVIRASIISTAAQTKSRLLFVSIGVLTVLFSGFGLSYLYSGEQETIDDLIVRTVDYDHATSNSRSGSIVLRSDGREDYTILDGIWKKYRDMNELVDDLNISNSAKIWLSSEDSREIQGIETSSVYIDPAKGIEWNKHNDRIGIWMCWTFIALGTILIILAFKYY